MLYLEMLTSAPPTLQRHARQQPNGISRVFAAAVVSREFREALLQEPETALAEGYLGQTFQLTAEEKRLLHTVQAVSLTDLAQKINRALKSA